MKIQAIKDVFYLFYIGHTSLFSSHEKEVYDNLVSVVGCEMNIRIRQNMFLINDKIYNKAHTEKTQVSSGRLAECLYLPGSDIDVMFLLNCVRVIQNVQHMNLSARYSTFLAEDVMECPGFTRLRLIAEGYHKYIFTSPECLIETINGIFLSNISFICIFIENVNYSKNSEHGPCLSKKDETWNIAYCVHLHTWSRQAERWIYRHRPCHWPPGIVIDEIINYGCILVPIGPKEVENNELLWRISFSMAEKQLSHAMNYTQFICYALLKLSLKNIIDRNDKVKRLLCSYFMKTALFWLSEEILTNAFQLQNVFVYLDKLISWVKS